MFSERVISILVVDDQPINLRPLSAILKQEGYTVRQAISGQAALDTVEAIAPDLILLDIWMPEMDGYTVCAKLKASPTTASIPVIFLSALSDAMDKTRAFAVGGSDYITKPFQAQEVLVRVQHQLTIQAQQRELLDLNQKLQHLNLELERQIKSRTLELEQNLTFERTLKRISDQVRDTLDQNQILQNAVVELAKALECHCCDAVLYDHDRLTSTLHYQYVKPEQPINQGQTPPMADAPKIYEQLHQKFWFAFCPIQLMPIHNHVAILVCPIFDDQVEEQGIVGDLWVFKPGFSSFSEQEVHLVEQVANQCAIALRQAQLYKAAQQQVKELERLNQLKDDFLSTISHELRTPLATMKLSLQMLNRLVGVAQTPDAGPTNFVPTSPQALKYLEILKQECDRELNLVQDLLDLQHLEAGIHGNEPTTIRLQDWLYHIIEAFEGRTLKQNQYLKLEIEQDLPPYTTDLPSLSRVITELLTNACKYTPAQGTITVSAALQGDLLCIRVTNTGIEIPPGELPHVFDKFYRIPSNDPWKYGGTGLGLALAKRLVEQLGGAIAATSQNQTVCFTLHLPIQPSGDL